ncbi:MAG: DNA gyrase inhibitor YacG [Xanthobacteraceae bacterium]|jgi:endogenous inhibitor of DNA gyrase (YacG/DUF329 family)
MNAHANSPAAKPCPICGKAAEPAFRPFCSKRCADVDLHRWFSGTYAVPAAPDEEDEDGAPPRTPEAG